MNKFAALGAGILLGVSCFFLGRSSVHQTTTDSKTISSPSTNEVAIKKISPPVSVENTPTVIPAATGWTEKKWNELLSQPGSPARNSELAAQLEKLGAVDPDRAMALAAAENNLKLREQLTQAALHGWARTSPTNATQWALNLPDATKREAAISTVFAGMVAADPDTAARMGSQIIQQNPDDAIGYGSRLIDALADAGDFQKAAQWASTGDSQTRSQWMAEAYSQWAEFQPEQAGQAAAAISDPAEKDLALHGIIGGWSQADPSGLVQFITQLPVGTDRDSLLSQSLERWAREDPVAASDWIIDTRPGPAMDQGIAAVATMPTLSPSVAITWAENIASPQLRSETVANVLRNWLTTDLSTAENYFASTKDLLPDDRQQIADVIAARNGQTSAQ